jgi:hypothetical protein
MALDLLAGQLQLVHAGRRDGQVAGEAQLLVPGCELVLAGQDLLDLVLAAAAGLSMDQGGAIWSVSNSDALVVQNLIVNNHAGAVGGGMSFEPPDESPSPLLLNNTFAGNTAVPDGSAVWTGDPTSPASVALTGTGI